MAWRLAKSLETLRAQINKAAPQRSKVSDGTIGDTRHSARKSDHNPNSKSVVCALDITHDPAGGCDAGAIAESLRMSADPRIGYLIWNKRISSPTKQGGAWRSYGGANPHTKHVHISVKQEAARYDDPSEWLVSVEPSEPITAETPRPIAKPVLRQGSKGEAVEELQALLGVKADGDFGPKTKTSLIAFQKAAGLVADGIAGAYTWDALLAKGAPTAPIAPPVASSNGEPSWAINFLESLGWPKLVATAIVAHLIWESGGNARNAKDQTIKWDAHGDKGRDGKYHSHAAPQWNDRHGRWQKYQAFAESRGTEWTNRESQLRYLDHELRTTEKGVANRLMEASTLEETVRIAVDFWRPSTPHLDKRLAIAKSLDK